jgi:hypothetical protein
MPKTGLIAAAAIVLSCGVAAAQTAHTPAEHKCWDNVSHQVRDQSEKASGNAGSKSRGAGDDARGSSGSTAAGGPAGAQGSETGLPSTMNRPGTSPLSNASPPNRPREAPGLPDCNT